MKTGTVDVRGSEIFYRMSDSAERLLSRRTEPEVYSRHTRSTPHSGGSRRGNVPVILVHGNSQSSRSFIRQMEGPLAERYPLFALDLPGHGNSTWSSRPRQDYSIRGMAATVAEFASSIGGEDAIFAGWSLGGHLLLEAADMLNSASGFMIFGTPPLPSPTPEVSPFLPHPAAGLLFKPELEESELETFLAALFHPDFGTVPEIFREDTRGTDGQFREVLGLSSAGGEFEDEVKIVATMQTPLAVLHGSGDQLVNLEYIRSLSYGSLWEEGIRVIQGSGHTPQWEQPEAFATTLDDFARACGVSEAIR